MSAIAGYKTYIVAALMVLLGIVEGLTGGGWGGVMDQLPIILNGLGIGALRAGVTKSGVS